MQHQHVSLNIKQLQWADAKGGHVLFRGLVESKSKCSAAQKSERFAHSTGSVLWTLWSLLWCNQEQHSGTSTLSPAAVSGLPSARPTGTYCRWHLYAHVTAALLIGLLNSISSGSRLEPLLSLRAIDTLGAAEANKGLHLLWPALPPVTRWYLLRALF